MTFALLYWLFLAIQINTIAWDNFPPADSQEYEIFLYSKTGFFWAAFLGCLASLVLKRAVKALMKPFYSKFIKETNTESEREKYAEQAADSTYRLLYFTCTSVLCFCALYQSPCLPWYLFGPANSSYELCLVGAPFQKQSHYFAYYMLTVAAYQLENTISHVFFDKRKGDFYELLGHHICGAIVPMGFALSRFGNLAIVLGFMFDLSDVLGQLWKVLNGLVF